MRRQHSEPFRIFREGSEVMQDALFHESVYDALRAVVERAGGAKAVGRMLRPGKSPDEAGRWVLDCLNSSRHERFAPEDLLHVLRIGREVGYHGAKHWIDSETGYSPTPPLDPEDQQAELIRVIATASDELRRATEALERVQSRKGARR